MCLASAAELADRSESGSGQAWGQLQLPIQIVPLPTDASWCNPHEKPGTLWVPQTAASLHASASVGRRPCPVARSFDRFLRQFADGSPALLRYVGLGLPD